MIPLGYRCKLLGDVTITPQCHFGAIYVTARESDKDIANAKTLLVVALARARNAGMKLNDSENEIIERGKAPILLEPVKASIAISGRAVEKINVLDHDGRRAERAISAATGRFTIDGTRDKTIYYEIVLR